MAGSGPFNRRQGVGPTHVCNQLQAIGACQRFLVDPLKFVYRYQPDFVSVHII
jgi:hypothetical protein